MRQVTKPREPMGKIYSIRPGVISSSRYPTAGERVTGWDGRRPLRSARCRFVKWHDSYVAEYNASHPRPSHPDDDFPEDTYRSGAQPLKSSPIDKPP